MLIAHLVEGFLILPGGGIINHNWQKQPFNRDFRDAHHGDDYKAAYGHYYRQGINQSFVVS